MCNNIIDLVYSIHHGTKETSLDMWDRLQSLFRKLHEDITTNDDDHDDDHDDNKSVPINSKYF